MAAKAVFWLVALVLAGPTWSPVASAEEGLRELAASLGWLAVAGLLLVAPLAPSALAPAGVLSQLHGCWTWCS